jgi:hypothetical protein
MGSLMMVFEIFYRQKSDGHARQAPFTRRLKKKPYRFDESTKFSDGQLLKGVMCANCDLIKSTYLSHKYKKRGDIICI